MAQITIYLPDPLAQRLKTEAKQQRKSLSKYIADLARWAFRPNRWPKGFSNLYGSWTGKLTVPNDPPPERVSDL